MEHASSKKITSVGGEVHQNVSSSKPTFVPTPEAKSKATQLRLFAGLLWLGAVVAQVAAIILLRKQVENFMAWVIGLIVVDLALAIIGSMLWKKSNRLDPASEKNGFKFFMQNQLGVVVAVIAFLPLVIFILTNKNISGKQKAILGSIAGLALVIAGISGAEFNPASVEQYTEQTAEVEQLNNGNNLVYWTKSGKSYHLYQDCHTINKAATTEIFQGTVAQARELKNIADLCDFCRNKAQKANETVIEPEAVTQEEVKTDSIK